MYKLRSTWNDVVSATKLHALDVIIHSMDKNWPLSAAPPNIHVNPKFLNNVYNFYFLLPGLHGITLYYHYIIQCEMFKAILIYFFFF